MWADLSAYIVLTSQAWRQWFSVELGSSGKNQPIDPPHIAAMALYTIKAGEFLLNLISTRVSGLQEVDGAAKGRRRVEERSIPVTIQARKYA
jgi:hypothetical protein